MAKLLTERQLELSINTQRGHPRLDSAAGVEGEKRQQSLTLLSQHRAKSLKRGSLHKRCRLHASSLRAGQGCLQAECG
eukprot:5252093-Alexandrium_andersonii.AAC.1